MSRLTVDLHRLARLCGVQTAYYDVSRRRRAASVDSLLAVLCAFGVGLDRLADAPEALCERRSRLAERGLEPVAVVWEDSASEVPLRFGRQSLTETAACLLQLESGEQRRFNIRIPDCAELPIDPDRPGFSGCRVPLPHGLPQGYHQLSIELGGRRYVTLVIVAPRRAYSAAPGQNFRLWGAFLPVYALKSQCDWGAGTFSELKQFASWLHARGAQVVATLPFLAGFMDEPSEPSPYAPVSRLFWNEFFIDVTQLPELAHCPDARRLIETPEFRAEIARQRQLELVDYRGQMLLKRRALELLARQLFQNETDRQRELLQIVTQRPELQSYARFRAVTETRRETWSSWPDALREGRLEPGDYDLHAEQYHLYVQWVASQQVHDLAEAAEQGAGLYLDYPLGVHSDGYDVWKHRRCFALDVAAGAPPDAVFTKGQNWGFPPLHPQGIREDGYRYFGDCIRHHLRFARLLRIDHVMGLHRLFWVPKGMEPIDGVYVQYPAQELYAILCLESHRHAARLFGENLGTVPAAVNRAMSRHNIRKMHAVQYELRPTGPTAWPAAPPGSIASLNTHDMPPFAAFWRGDDIDDRASLGLLDAVAVATEHRNREILRRRLVALLIEEGRLSTSEPELSDIMRACLERLADGPAEAVVINLEDLWLDPRPQNVPATGPERPNWRRKALFALEEFERVPGLKETLAAIAARRC